MYCARGRARCHKLDERHRYHCYIRVLQHLNTFYITSSVVIYPKCIVPGASLPEAIFQNASDSFTANEILENSKSRLIERKLIFKANFCTNMILSFKKT